MEVFACSVDKREIYYYDQLMHVQKSHTLLEGLCFSVHFLLSTADIVALMFRKSELLW